MRIIFFLFIWIATLRASESLIFYHIPKTAGSTLVNIIGYHYHADDVMRIFASKKLNPHAEKWADENFYVTTHEAVNNTEKLLSNVEFPSSFFMKGHVYFKDANSLLPKAKKITFLRDPVKRVISHHNFWKFVNRNYPGDNMAALHLIPKGDPLQTSNNLQVYYLSSYSRDDSKISLQTHLESAKRNLEEHFDFVGITEKFNESYQLLSQLMNWNSIPNIPKINKGCGPLFCSYIF